MPKTTAWYSKREGTEVYHDNSLCTEVNNIEAYNCKGRDRWQKIMPSLRKTK
jgi:hypothetical protein